MSERMPFRAQYIAVPRTARYLLLGDAADPVDEIWFVLHGYLQDVSRFLRWFEPAARPGRLIVAPEGLSRAYVDPKHEFVGASWMTKEERQLEMRDYIRYLDLVAHEVLGERARTGVRIEVHGFSQGGATGCRWAVHGQVRPDAVVLWGSAIPPELTAEEVRGALDGEPVHLLIGTRDQYYTPKIVAQEKVRLDGLGIPYAYREFDGTHRVEVGIWEASAAG